MGVERGELVLGAHVQPALEVLAVAGVQGVQRQHGQREVVHPVAHLGDLELHGVVLVNLGQHHDVVTQDLLHGVEQVGGVGLLEEAAAARALAGVGEGVQTDDGGAVGGHVAQGLVKEALGALALHVDIDLLLAEGAPDLLGGAVGELGLDVRRARLAFVDGVDLLVRGEAALGCPEVLVADEEVGKLAVVLLGQEVLEVRALARDVVDHEVEHEVAVVANRLDVLPATEVGVDDVVTHGGEPAVGRAREERQDVHAAHCLVEVGVEHLLEVR